MVVDDEQRYVGMVTYGDLREALVYREAIPLLQTWNGSGPYNPQLDAIVYADLDLSEVPKQRQNFDPTGHYSRPEILRLEVNRSRRG